MEDWIGSADMEHLVVGISNVALAAASDRTADEVKLRPQYELVDGPLGALGMAAP